MHSVMHARTGWSPYLKEELEQMVTWSVLTMGGNSMELVHVSVCLKEGR